ncbi:hypothetical protein EC988_000779 [Linderina pennispora]|nr:hypothetical protein EC988_000779 [Linderina pennispora]
MSSRILSRARLSAARITTAQRPCGADMHSTAVAHRIFGSKIKELIASAQEVPDPLTKPNVPSINRLTGRQRRGGYKNDAGMPAYVPIKAKNTELAWNIWAFQTNRGQRNIESRNGEAARRDLVDLILLLAESQAEQPSSSIFNPVDTGKEVRLAETASYRVATALKQLFVDSVRGVYDDKEGTGSQETEPKAELSQCSLGLGLKSANEYERILDKVLAGLRSDISKGNSPVLATDSLEQMALSIEDSPVSRIVHLLFVAASQDGVTASPRMVQDALDIAIATGDVTAARDILNLTYPDLAAVLDPAMPGPSAAQTKIFGNAHSENCRTAVEKVLQLVAVGQDPQTADISVYPDGPQDEISNEQLESLAASAFGRSVAEVDPAVLQWRVQTSESIYRMYISSGISEVPSPDNSPKTALQGSVTPSTTMLASLLKINCDAGNVEHTAILYDTLLAAAGELSQQSNDTQHKLNFESWCSVAQAIGTIKQTWLMERVIGDLIGDQWSPSENIYRLYLESIAQPATLNESLASLKSTIGGASVLSSSGDILEPLIQALLQHPGAKGNECALQIAGLPGADSPETSWTADNGAAISDKTVRSIVSAFISAGQITRARELAELWSADRPGLITSQSLAELILGLGRAGDYNEALGLFASMQGAETIEITLEILSSVLQVYVMAEDFEEAVSVSKRIRAIVKEGVDSGDAEIPTRETYSCMIKAYCAYGQPNEALRALEEMRIHKVHASTETYTTLLKSMSSLRSLDGLKLIVALANVDNNMHANGPDGSSSVPLPLDTAYFNALIEAYGRVGSPERALQAWEMMRQRGVKPDNTTASLLIDTCAWNERVHWAEDMQPQSEFVERNEPEDHVYTGMPFFQLHYLGSTLKELQEAGLELNMANYRHLLEALIRTGFLEEAMDMVIGRYEDAEERTRWGTEAHRLLQHNDQYFLTGLFSLFKKNEAQEPPAKFMDVQMELPLERETVQTIFGMIEAVRAKCSTKEDPEPWEAPFVQRTSPSLLQRLDLHQQRLVNFLRSKRPDLLPASSE